MYISIQSIFMLSVLNLLAFFLFVLFSCKDNNCFVALIVFVRKRPFSKWKIDNGVLR